MMALTGVCLVLFVTFHCLMNTVAIAWPSAYNEICMFLGANWYALIASIGLAVLFIIHIIYAVWLTVQNRAARGNDRYEVTTRPPQVEWSSKNMLVLGIVILAFLVVHLIQFWAKMQLQEIMGTQVVVDGVPQAPEFGTLFLQAAFSMVWTPIVYIIGFIALWFHMTHGFWSMFHSVGWDNNIWINRLKCISNWWTTIVVVLFVAQAIAFTVMAKNNTFLTSPALQEQYGEYWGEQAEKMQQQLYEDLNALGDNGSQEAYMAVYQNVCEKLGAILESADKQCPGATNPQLLQGRQMYIQLSQFMQQVQMQPQMQMAPDDVEVEEVEAEETIELN